MTNNHTDITIVLDRSGSMTGIADDTIGGFNRFLEDQKKVPGSCNLSLHQFDDVFETVIDAKPVAQAEPLTPKTFVPRGSTALLDAIGRAVTDTGTRLSKKAADKVIFVIITDGHENASREFTHAKVKEMIEHQKSKYAWEFVYLGANQDAIQVGMAMGVNPANNMSYGTNKMGTQVLYRTVSYKMGKFRAAPAGAGSMSYTAADYAQQAAANAVPDKEEP